MIATIIEEFESSDWDFTKFANAGEAQAAKFDEWVVIYRLKYAIAKVLKPKKILEIGVRFGYSARALVHGAEHGGQKPVEYLGIDNNQSKFGGVDGSLDWAKKNFSQDGVVFQRDDTQRMEQLPGGQWDLIHVDGQQDYEGIRHDLSLAIKQTGMILLDGYWWTPENKRAIDSFLVENKCDIMWSAIINDRGGRYGDVLIAVRDEARTVREMHPAASQVTKPQPKPASKKNPPKT